MSMGKESVSKVKDIVTGLAAGGASLAGWSAGEAALLGVKAEEATTARLALGQDFDGAMDASISEAEMVLVMDVFCKAMDETGDAQAAFDRVVAIKMNAAEGAPGAETALKVARPLSWMLCAVALPRRRQCSAPSSRPPRRCAPGCRRHTLSDPRSRFQDKVKRAGNVGPFALGIRECLIWKDRASVAPEASQTAGRERPGRVEGRARG
ncbi:MAG: hypothetical protein HPM95_00820 [Alphaproteobacteria bacterium]|nr:hypothetical protein [Alphaproteobacteria bacterium]